MTDQGMWQVQYRLGDGCRIKHGYSCKSEFMTTEEIGKLPVIVNIGNFDYQGGFRFERTKVQRYKEKVPDRYLLKSGDLLVVMTCQTPGGEILGLPGRIPADGRIYLHNQRLGLVVLADNDHLDRDFLYWLFLSPPFNRYLCATASGSKILHTSPALIEEYRFSRPSIGEQREIAGILNGYEALINNYRKRIRLLEEMTAKLYRAWFVQFRFPGAADVTYKPSVVGVIPENWKVGSLTNMVTIYSGGTPKTTVADYWNGAIPFFTPRDASDRFYTLSTEKCITRAGLENCSSRLYPKNTIFVSARGTVGKVVMNGKEMAMNQSCYALRGYQGQNQYYFFLMLKNYIDMLKQCSQGAVFDVIVVDTFRTLRVAQPPPEMIKDFNTLITPFFQLILQLEKQILILQRIRQMLLPELLSGHVRAQK